MYQLFVVLLTCVVMAVGAVTGAFDPAGGGSSLFVILILLLVFGLFIPNLAVQVRRLHDQDKSGWWVLLSFVPLGGLVLLVFYFLDGTPGENRFGPDPKGRAGSGVFE